MIKKTEKLNDMRIGYPAAGIDEEQMFLMSKDFTESGLIGIYDISKRNLEVFKKEELGKDLLSWLSANKIEAIVTPEIQMMAHKVFAEKKIKVYKAMSNLIKLNAELLEADSLSPFSQWELKQKSACSSSECSSCNSNNCN